MMDASVVDPVCWMDVARESVKGSSEYKGKIYYFCSTTCKAAFDENPEEYVGDEDENEESRAR